MKTNGNKGETKGNPRDPFEKKGKTVSEIVRKEQEGAGAGRNVKIIQTFDDTFGIPIVYAYGDFELYRDLEKLLFKGNTQTEAPASGYAKMGPAAEELGDFQISLVWINNKKPLRETVPTMVHEIVHVAQDILLQAGVDDKAGELQAYTVGREYTRVMREFYGIDMDDTNMSKRQSVKNAVSKILATLENGMPKAV